jgi:hypothetical protein
MTMGMLQAGPTIAGPNLDNAGPADREAFDLYFAAQVGEEGDDTHDTARALRVLATRHVRFGMNCTSEESRAWDKYVCAAITDGSTMKRSATRADDMLRARQRIFGKR